MLGSSLELDGCEPDASDFDEATKSRSEIEGPCVAADEGSGIEDCIRDEGKPLVDARWGDAWIDADAAPGASATTVLGAEAAHARLERHAHQAVD